MKATRPYIFAFSRCVRSTGRPAYCIKVTLVSRHVCLGCYRGIFRAFCIFGATFTVPQCSTCDRVRSTLHCGTRKRKAIPFLAVEKKEWKFDRKEEAFLLALPRQQREGREEDRGAQSPKHFSFGPSFLTVLLLVVTKARPLRHACSTNIEEH